MMLLLVVGYGVFHIKAQVLLITAAFLSGLLGFILKFKWPVMEKGIIDSIHKAMPAVLIMLAVGILVGTWIAAGFIGSIMI
jgi:NhaC family Na+:H+ antiporter